MYFKEKKMREKMKLVIPICLLLLSCAKENILPPDWADDTNPVYWEGNILFGKQIVAYGDAIKLSRKDNNAKDDAEKLAIKKALIKISKKNKLASLIFLLLTFLNIQIPFYSGYISTETPCIFLTILFMMLFLPNWC